MAKVPAPGEPDSSDPAAVHEEVLEVLVLHVVGQAPHKDGVAVRRLVTLLGPGLKRRGKTHHHRPVRSKPRFHIKGAMDGLGKRR